ncbi:MAG: tetratricopeptide repeat protein [Pirellulaceae bacterium]|jgi:tetratricopeptide (TPR) repeat protein/serine/threonine protein kinase|nr:tetratricopeptide repeat protein [Thermoguttaceae bacterium]NLZ00771.1 tetratricopeptide repeat protein [Pirellulaceae bacterium]
MRQEFAAGCEPVPGTGYRLLSVLGRGGFGEVWKATAPGGAEVAVKVIRLGGREGRKEFKALQLVKKVRHPNLVPTIAFWLLDADGQVIDEDLLKQDDWLKAEPGASPRATMVALPAPSPFQPKQLIVVMGLGDKTLNDRLEECQQQGLVGIPEDELLSYMEDAARAIDFLNSPVHAMATGPAAIQHCDIKPHNIMIVGDSAQVCDFGLAQMLGADRTTTAAASLAYAAPECLREGKPSGSTDQYSLAVTYYELRTGLLPYREQTQMAVMDAKIRQELDFCEVSAKERAVLARATSANPEARFSSTSEFVERLRAAVRGEDQAAGRRPRSPLLVPISVTIGLALAVLGGLWLLHRQDERRAVQTPEVSRQDGGRIGAPSREAGTDGARPEQPPADPIAEILAAAEQQQAAGNFREAADSYTRAIAISEEDAEAFFHRGECLLKLGEAPSAIADFERAAELDKDRYGTHPAMAEAYLARGTEALKNHEPEGAIGDLTEAIRHKPRDGQAYSRRGVAHFTLKQFPEAVNDFTSSIEIDNDSSDYVRRGKALQVMGRADEAIADFTKAAQIDPKNVAAYYYLGDCLLQRDDREQAIAAFSEAIRAGEAVAEPPEELSSAYALRANCKMQIEQFGDALADLTQAIRLGSQDLRSLYEWRASCFEKLGRMSPARYDRWILASLEALEKDADDPMAHNELAYYLATSPEAEIRDGKKALQHAQRACELTSWKEAEYLDTLAACHAENGDFAEAIRWSQTAIELATDAEVAEYYTSALKLYQENKPYRDQIEAAPEK